MNRSAFMQQALQSRISIDAKRQGMQQAATVLARPIGGWIQAIRTGLGMSATDLARRLGVGTASVTRLEASEKRGAISLESLKRVADELNCELVYALVPREDLATTVRNRALAIARRRLTDTQATMALENQSLGSEVLNKLIEQRANELAESRSLWKPENDNL